MGWGTTLNFANIVRREGGREEGSAKRATMQGMEVRAKVWLPFATRRLTTKNNTADDVLCWCLCVSFHFFRLKILDLPGIWGRRMVTIPFHLLPRVRHF